MPLSKACSYTEAKEKGLSRYFTGRPCKHGHVAERTTSRRTCVECIRLWHKKNNQINCEKVRAQKRKYYEENKEKVLSATNLYKKQNPEKARAVVDAWRRKNKDRRNEQTAAYRAAKKNATPSWLSSEDRALIRSLYKKSQELSKSGKTYHVDHIVPLQGVNFSGLHVPWNLQLLPSHENQSKRNRLLDAA